jgi:ribosomal protein S18 acetylase RimI-like enzyme
MSSISPDAFISEIDTERFGIITARVVGLTSESLSSVLDFCGAKKVELLIARCDMLDLDAAQSMERKGFLLMDTLVYYSLDLTKKDVPVDKGVVLVRPIHIEEEKEMILVARESFRGYFGHYHADKRLNKSKCDEVYVDWARKVCAARDSGNFLVAEVEGRIAGFGVLKMNNSEEGEYFLGGIHPDFQGRRIYYSFLCKAMEWFLSRGAQRMLLSTQLQNISVQKVLIRFGLEITKGYYTYHKWFY